MATSEPRYFAICVDLKTIKKETWWQFKDSLEEAGQGILAEFLKFPEQPYYGFSDFGPSPEWWMDPHWAYVIAADGHGNYKPVASKALFKTAEEVTMTAKQKEKYDAIFKELTKDDMDFQCDTVERLGKKGWLSAVELEIWRAVANHRKRVERAVMMRWRLEKDTE